MKSIKQQQKSQNKRNTTANSLKSDLAKVKNWFNCHNVIAVDAKTSASEAKQQLTTVANDLSKAKQDLTSQAQQLQAQASAQSELTKTCLNSWRNCKRY